jgi:general secretion pathway protein I
MIMQKKKWIKDPLDFLINLRMKHSAPNEGEAARRSVSTKTRQGLSGFQPLVSAHSGFTLLEVMVALSILALGIVTVLELFAGSLRLGVKASRHTQAALYAQNVMDRLFAQTTLDDGNDGGEFPDGYSWQSRIQEIHPDDDSSRLQPNRANQTDFFHLKEIEVQIVWEENGGSKTFVLKSLRTQAEQQNNAQNNMFPTN